MTNESVRGREHEFSIDGTGMPTTVKENYADDKEKKSFNMLMLMNGVQYKLISAFDSDIGHVNESPYLRPLLEETNSKHDSISLVCGDATYISKANCNAIAAIGAIPRIGVHP